MSVPIYPNNFNLAQFVPTGVQGKTDLIPNNAFNVRVAQSQTYPLIPGAALKLAGTSSSIMEVVAANPSDNIIGFVPYLTVRNSFSAGDVFTMIGDLGVMWMTAESSFSAGAVLEYDNITDRTKVQVKESAGVNTPIGIAYNSSSGAGSLVRVYIKLPGVKSYTTPSS